MPFRVITRMKKVLYTIYDIFEYRSIDIHYGEKKHFAKSIGLHPSGISHLASGKQISVLDRYILPSNKHLIFTCVDQHGQEYPCISNTSLFIHLNIPPSDNYHKYLSATRVKRQKYFSISDRLFYIKEHFEEGQYPKMNTTVLTPEIAVIRLRNKRKTNLARTLRNRLSSAIKRQLAKKHDHTLDLLGIPMDEFMDYLEQQFTEGMTWENKGQWHIDHIVPCSSFNLLERSEQEKCFHYTNLQPLWAADNYRKGSSLP